MRYALLRSRYDRLASTIEVKAAYKMAAEKGDVGLAWVDEHPFGLYKIWSASKGAEVPTLLGRTRDGQFEFAGSDAGLVAMMGSGQHQDVRSFAFVKSWVPAAYLRDSDLDGYRGLRAVAEDARLSQIDAQGVPSLEEALNYPCILDLPGNCADFPPSANHMPFSMDPAGSFISDDEATTELKKLAQSGARQRYGQELPAEIKTRALYELSIIAQKGYSNYFLVVADYVGWAKDQGIYVGPGRGSGGGSLIAYCVGITDIDPLEHQLIFERFLNPERPSAPDFDIDFEVSRRQEVIDYVRDKYGPELVTPIITRTAILGKSALRDSGRILGFPSGQGGPGDRLARAMPKAIVGREMPLWGCLDPSHPRYDDAESFREMVAEDEMYEQIVQQAIMMEGATRSWGVHAAGVIMSRTPLSQVIPLVKNEDGVTLTGFDYPDAESLGVVKMDFLGLRNLDVIKHALASINDPVLSSPELIPMGDQATYDLLARGDTIGVFQLEGSNMRSLLRLMRPTEFGDISAVVALYRPGPMGANAHIDYANRKNGAQIKPIHPELSEALEPILGETYGLIVYQEQVLRIAQDLAGYTLGGADSLRRALGKKKVEAMAAEFETFSAGMLSNGFSMESIESLWDVLVPFADYSFNRSHSAAYGIISYWTAYLKANYPVEYMAALMDSVADRQEKLAIYLAECRRMGIEILPPTIAEARSEFLPLGDSQIRFGISAIRSVGDGVVENIGALSSAPRTLGDVLQGLNHSIVTKTAWQNLVYAGALDGLGWTRKALAESLPLLLKLGKSSRAAIEAGLPGLPLDGLTPTAHDDYSDDQKLALERKVLGLYITGHPLDEHWATISGMRPQLIAELDEEEDGGKVRRLGGIVVDIFRRTDKSGRAWAIVTLADVSGEIEILFFADSWGQVKDKLRIDQLLVADSYIKYRDGSPSAYANLLFMPGAVDWSKLEISMREDEIDLEKIDTLLELLQQPFGSQVDPTLVVTMPDGVKQGLRLRPGNINPESLAELVDMFGLDKVVVR